jgi:hypothetical protein
MTHMNACDNVLEELDLATREDVITDLLAYCLRRSAELRFAFFDNLGLAVPADPKFTTRPLVPTAGIPDLVAHWTSPLPGLLVLEHKLSADEGPGQTQSYASEACRNGLIKKFLTPSQDPVNVHYVILALFADVEPSSARFRKCTHQELCKAFRPLVARQPGLIPPLLGAWIELVDRFHGHAVLADDDLVADALRREDPLEGAFLYFRSLLASLILPAGFALESTFRNSQQGRRYYGAQISKPDWHPSKWKETNGIYDLDPNTCFHIHFEPQYNVLTGTLSLYLHYEINPYRPSAWAKSNFPKDLLLGYEERRCRFIEALQHCGIRDLRIGGRSNQVAKATLSLEGRRAKQVRESFQNIVCDTAASVDKILHEGSFRHAG